MLLGLSSLGLTGYMKLCEAMLTILALLLHLLNHIDIWLTYMFFFFLLFKHALHRPFNILSTFSLSHRWTIVFVKTSDGADKCPHCGTASCKGYSCMGARNVPGASCRLGESICSQEWHCVPWHG